MAYPSDLKDKEWKRIEGYFQSRGVGGRTPKHSKQAIVNAVLYVVKSGCQWRMLPKDFPPWKTVYDHFRRRNLQGVWEQVLDELNRQHRTQVKKYRTQLRHCRLTSRMALPSCPGAGLSNAPSPGWAISGAWPRMSKS